MSTPHAINMLASQISEFGGLENENVRLWIQRIEKVATIHQVSDDIILLAATTKVTKIARRWFDLGSGSMLESWQGFREAILKRFARKVLYHVALQTIEARKWLYSKESFLEYAMDKLAIMHTLDLPDESAIHLLISGIGSKSLHEIAASLKTDSLDQFLDRMHQITSVSAEPEKKPSGDFKAHRPKDPTGKSVTKNNTTTMANNSNSPFCAYCKIPGHSRANCFKLKRKEQTTSTTATAAPSPTVAAVTDPQEEECVAFVQAPGRNVKVCNSVLKISRINGTDCTLSALIDTGSPISFVKSRIFNKYFPGRDLKLMRPSRKYKALNDEPVAIKGVIRTGIELTQLKNLLLTINLHVLEDCSIVNDIIIGRDFLETQQITVVYNPRGKTAKINCKSLEPWLQVLAGSLDGPPDHTYDDLEIDYDSKTKTKLRDLLKQIENMSVKKIDDDYFVEVRLKDESIYAYAPRRFAHAEKIKIREITDDLLARDIIKESNSPYCARSLLVPKKNGQLRLCVDLRPLNARVIKQKFPFPL